MRLLSALVVIVAAPVWGYLDDYYCGVGPISKSLSYLTASMCGTDPINGCCREHDRCFEWNLNTPFITGCDQEFADCSYDVYMEQNQTYCANLIYYTHGQIIQVFGTPFRNLIGYGFGK